VSTSAAIYEINPLQDERWIDLLTRHPAASVFHSRAWLSALARTYGYQPAVLTTSAPGDALADGLAFCRVSSWLTGRRLVSLPLSDHCDILAGDGETIAALATAFREQSAIESRRYAELRPTMCLARHASGFRNEQAFVLHRLDLRPEVPDLLHRFHPSCVQRKIRRAEREQLDVESGRDARLLEAFYGLTVRTRRRHGIPAQPLAWFRHLIDEGGDMVRIYLAAKDGRPVAGVLTLGFKKTLTYKYAASDEAFHATGGAIRLLWQIIQEGRARGYEELDLGRSDIDNVGLTAFKDHWAASRSPLCYWRSETSPRAWRRAAAIPAALWAHAPVRLVAMAGRLLYKHAG
jgi:hypothetical protein